MNGILKVVFQDFLQKTKFYDRIPTKRRMSGHVKYIKNDLDDDVSRILNLDTKLSGKGV